MKYKLLVSLFFPAFTWPLNTFGFIFPTQKSFFIFFFPSSFLFLLLLFNSSGVWESGKINWFSLTMSQRADQVNCGQQLHLNLGAWSWKLLHLSWRLAPCLRWFRNDHLKKKQINSSILTFKHSNIPVDVEERRTEIILICLENNTEVRT